MILAIDGPAASGKSTVAKELARRLNANYLDTGAIYRALTWEIVRSGVDVNDELALEKIAKATKIKIMSEIKNGGKFHIYVNNEDVSDKIRTPEISAKVSDVSKYARVRKVLLEMQRKVAENGDLVAEGRDMGTVVFPEADLKIFLAASARERAKRRKADLEAGGHDVELDELEKLIAKRDQTDSSRTISPLSMAKDAILVDTTDKTVSEVTEEIVALFKEKIK